MKKSWNTFGACLLAASLGLAAGPATASDDCDAPVARWQTREAVTQVARQKGWDLKRVKIDEGCYEVRGEDAQGRAFKAKLDPETLEIVKIKYRDHGDRDRDRRRDQDHRDSPGAAPGAAD
ncbi:MAG: PepSY domain-containing protein [Castellaniella sp.]|uniref:PepSY domain-containing protein n=1 Tax=Castellaniella sp. TaxID=1955812 RepID=UPI0011FE54D0|nr:PepSY domain-containing protein [Castellaniella sp.]TAN30518.1 MAG: PepSY domain-containing protein [Castellaniella sp.]